DRTHHTHRRPRPRRLRRQLRLERRHRRPHRRRDPGPGDLQPLARHRPRRRLRRQRAGADTRPGDRGGPLVRRRRDHQCWSAAGQRGRAGLRRRIRARRGRDAGGDRGGLHRQRPQLRAGAAALSHGAGRRDRDRVRHRPGEVPRRLRRRRATGGQRTHGGHSAPRVRPGIHRVHDCCGLEGTAVLGGDPDRGPCGGQRRPPTDGPACRHDHQRGGGLARRLRHQAPARDRRRPRGGEVRAGRRVGAGERL
ncbi:MAG: hypothetical protein AVDCRST_MAG54-3513, partial [uncultured Actinomycetospora sp.]